MNMYMYTVYTFSSPSLRLSLSSDTYSSVCETVVPKLIAEDIPLLHSLLQDVFPGVPYRRAEMAALRKEISSVCKDYHLVFGEGEQATSQWVDKVGMACQEMCAISMGMA